MKTKCVFIEPFAIRHEFEISLIGPICICIVFVLGFGTWLWLKCLLQFHTTKSAQKYCGWFTIAVCFAFIKWKELLLVFPCCNLYWRYDAVFGLNKIFWLKASDETEIYLYRRIISKISSNYQYVLWMLLWFGLSIVSRMRFLAEIKSVMRGQTFQIFHFIKFII